MVTRTCRLCPSTFTGHGNQRYCDVCKPKQAQILRRRTYHSQKNANPDRYRAKAAQRQMNWRATNRERTSQLNRESYERHREQRLAEKRDYAQRHPERIQTNNRRQKNARRAATFGDPLWTELYISILLRDPCAYCGALPGFVHIDHIEPIKLGGAHDWSNLAAACPHCNQSKRAQPLLEFLCQHHVPSDQAYCLPIVS